MNRKYARIDLKPSWIQTLTPNKGLTRMKDLKDLTELLNPAEIDFITRMHVPMDIENVKAMCINITHCGFTGNEQENYTQWSNVQRPNWFVTRKAFLTCQGILEKIDEYEFDLAIEKTLTK
jgi:hypothetical protein